MNDPKKTIDVRLEVVLAIMKNSQHKMDAVSVLEEAIPLSEWILGQLHKPHQDTDCKA